MIRREKGSRNVIFHCDGCSEVFDSETDNFDEALEGVKADGWKLRKEDDEWMHWCPVCNDK